MVSPRAIGILTTDPQRGHVALHTLRAAVSLPAEADAIGIASCVDRAVLLTRKPTVAPGAELAALSGPLKGRVAVVQIRGADELRPPRNETGDVGPWRSRNLACAVVGGPQDVDEAAACRDAHLASLPDFLRRNVTGHGEGEAFFFAVLGALHRKGQLTENALDPIAVVAAVREVHQARSSKAKRHVTFATGTDLAHVSLGFDNAVVRIEGLDEATAVGLDPTLTDSAIGRERLRRFRAVFALGHLGTAFEDKRGLPKGATVLGQPADSACVIRRDLEIQAV